MNKTFDFGNILDIIWEYFENIPEIILKHTKNIEKYTLNFHESSKNIQKYSWVFVNGTTKQKKHALQFSKAFAGVFVSGKTNTKSKN